MRLGLLIRSLFFHSRSISCDHHGSSQTLRLTPQPPKQKHSLPVHSSNQRPGYVTLPRRPRSSWSAPPRESPTPSIQYAMTLQRPSKREPIYDGVGPRTSADGSSMGTLPRSSNKPCSPVGGGTGGHKVSLGPYYAPIAELQECPNSPKDECKQKTPNSSSEMTLMEESISSYCEPFGKALAPPAAHETTPTPLSSSNSTSGTAKSRHSTTSAESELEALIIPNGQSSHENGHKLENDIPPMMPLLPPIMTANHGIAETSFNGNSESENNGGGANKKVPPKTLPKPKVRPLPPPKPNKSAMLNRPVTFQDEGVDGSEV